MDNLNKQDSPATPRQGFDALGTGGPVACANHPSNLLRPFGIFSCDIKVDGVSLKEYRLPDFQECVGNIMPVQSRPRDRENSVAAT